MVVRRREPDHLDQHDRGSPADDGRRGRVCKRVVARMRESSKRLCVVVVLLGLGGAERADQTGSGVLTGTVIDSDKKPLGDVIVIATSPAVQGQQITVTDASGYFRIAGLPA